MVWVRLFSLKVLFRTLYPDNIDNETNGWFWCDVQFMHEGYHRWKLVLQSMQW